MNTDTPRTDALHGSRFRYCDPPHEYEEMMAHARQLERELAEVTKQRDTAIEGLEKLASCDWVITLPDRMDAVREIARDTLNKIQS